MGVGQHPIPELMKSKRRVCGYQRKDFVGPDALIIERIDSWPDCKQYNSAEREHESVLTERMPYACEPIAASRCEMPNRRLKSIVRDRNCPAGSGYVATDHL